MVRIIDNTKLFQRASEAIDKDNYDYAVELFQQILVSDPDDIKARITVRQTAKMRIEKKGGGGFGASLAGIPALLTAWLLTLFRKRDKAIVQYEKFLSRSPFNPFVLGLLGSALRKTGRDESAILVLEFLRQNKPSHVRNLRRLAQMYVDREDISRAMQRYQMILKYRPADIAANKRLHDLSATESIQEGWDKGGDFQEKIRDKEAARRLEDAQHMVRTADQAASAIDRVTADLENSPDNPVLWAEMGDLHRRRDDFASAVEAYEKALTFDTQNQQYVQKLMDARLMEYEHVVKQASDAAEAAPDDAALKAKLAEAVRLKDEFWLEETQRRAEARPTDTGLRFELGSLYFKAGEVNKATAAFQRVVRDPKYRVAATAMLGRCFAAKGLDELAIEQFEQALKEASINEETGKDIAYHLGTLQERVGNFEQAENSFKKIFQIDIGYRDIAEKMESIYKKRRQGKKPSNSDED